jgi:transcription elongation factor GreA
MDRDYLSQEKHGELMSELEDLKMNRRREVAERLEAAKALGDLSENAEYHAAREEQSEIEDRITQLESLLKNADIISLHHSSVVEIGSTLVVEKKGGPARSYTIVGSEETNTADGKISYHSPLGAALLGKHAGDNLTVETPRGPVDYRIVSLD